MKVAVTLAAGIGLVLMTATGCEGREITDSYGSSSTRTALAGYAQRATEAAIEARRPTATVPVSLYETYMAAIAQCAQAKDTLMYRRCKDDVDRAYAAALGLPTATPTAVRVYSTPLPIATPVPLTCSSTGEVLQKGKYFDVVKTSYSFQTLQAAAEIRNNCNKTLYAEVYFTLEDSRTGTHLYTGNGFGPLSVAAGQTVTYTMPQYLAIQPFPVTIRVKVSAKLSLSGEPLGN